MRFKEIEVYKNHLKIILGFFRLFFGETALPLVGQGLLIDEIFRSHTTTHHTR
jgi:hypothetical protein